LELAAQASLEKRVFLEKLLARGETGVLAMLAMRPNNEPFLRLNWTAHAICPVGLSELVQKVIGEPLARSAAAQDFAARVITHLNAEAERLSDKHKVRLRLATSRDLSAPHRLAKLDLERFGADDAIDPNEVHYTNATQLPSQSEVSVMEKLRIEGVLQQGVVMGATSELWGNETLFKPEPMAVLVSRAFYQTNNAALTLSPEFTACLACHTATRGRAESCPQCASTKLDVLALATSHYSRVSTWPRWKVAEFKLRKRASVP
jgi:ribonucleoside-triphosphate reductase